MKLPKNTSLFRIFKQEIAIKDYSLINKLYWIKLKEPIIFRIFSLAILFKVQNKIQQKSFNFGFLDTRAFQIWPLCNILQISCFTVKSKKRRNGK